MLFKSPTELEQNLKGITHSKTCRHCKKVFLYKAGKEWDEQRKLFQISWGLKPDRADPNPVIYYK